MLLKYILVVRWQCCRLLGQFSLRVYKLCYSVNSLFVCLSVLELLFIRHTLS